MVRRTSMMKILSTFALMLCLSSQAFAQAEAPGRYIVTATSLNVRLAADTSGKLVDKLDMSERVNVIEVRDGWARISEYYDGTTEGLSGRVARWVYAAHLTDKPPAAERLKVNPAVYDAISASEDLEQLRDIFAQASQRLINNRRCKLSDFRDIGGWWRSAEHNPEPIYYTYCGGATNSDRVYVDTRTGEIFQ